MNTKFQDYFTDKETRKENEKTALFGISEENKQILIDQIFTNNDFYKECIDKLGIKTRSDLGNNLLEYTFIKIDELINVEKISEKLGITAFIYGNVDAMANRIFSIIDERIFHTRRTSFVESILKDLAEELDVIRNNSQKTFNVEEEKFDYKIKDNLLIIEDKGSPFDEFNVKNVLNNIIVKETYEKLQKLRIFYHTSTGEAYEVYPKYENDKFTKIELLKI